jgi:hypothetical protein
VAVGKIEKFESDGQPKKEVCLPNHFYAAYIFDQPNSHQKEIRTIFDEASNLGRSSNPLCQRGVCLSLDSARQDPDDAHALAGIGSDI